MIFHFRAYAKDTTTVLGTLTEAEDKRFRVHYNGPGEGSFSINRHSSQAGWVAAGNYVRVHIGNIFTDPVFGFFIGQGDDTTVSQDEEGGEILTRAGPGALSYLSRAIIDPTGSNARYKDGVWRWTDGTMGQIMADLIDDAQARGALPRLTYDFDATNDSNGAAWDVFDGDYDLNVGLQLDEAMGRLQSAGFIARMSPGFVLSAYKTVGTDLSGSITFEKGVNITADGQREVFASPAKSAMLVQGTTKAGALKFVWANDAGVQTALGERIEGFTNYQSTASDTVLGRVGTQAIRRLKKRHDGLSQLGVLETTFVPFVHYQPGDTVNVNIPGEFDNLHAPATAIALVEDETGQAMAALEFEDIAFEPLQLNDKSDPSQSPSSGGSGAGGGSPSGGCGDCPPFTGGGTILVADPSVEALTLHFWEAAVPGSFMTETTNGTPVTTAYGGFGFGVAPSLAADNTKQSTAGCEYLDTTFERRMAMSYNADAGGGLIYDMATVHLELVGIEEGPGDPQTAKVKLMRGNWPTAGPPNETGLGLATVDVPLTADSVFSDPDATIVTYDFAFGFSGSLAQMIIAIDNGAGEQPGWVVDSYAPDICNVTALHHAQVASSPPIDQAYQVQIDTTNSTITLAKRLITTIVTPVPGQTVSPEGVVETADGTRKTFTIVSAPAYMAGSLHVSVNSVDWTAEIVSQDASKGTFTLSHAPKPGSDIIVTYRAAEATVSISDWSAAPAFGTRTASGTISMTGQSGFTISGKKFVSQTGSGVISIHLENCSNFVITDCDFDGDTEDIFLHNCSDFEIKWCRSNNIIGPHARDGSHRANFVQMDSCTQFHIHDIKILGGDTEDVISCFKSGGRSSSSPSIIERVAMDLTGWTSGSGTGVILGDGGTGSYVEVRNCTFLHPGQVGVQIIDGIGHRIHHNKLYSQPGQPTSPNVAISSFSGSPSAEVSFNDVYWRKNDGSQNPRYFGAGSISDHDNQWNDTGLTAGSIAVTL